MARLPKIQHQIHTCYLKSCGKELKIRPYTVKDEKILMMAAESDKFHDMVDAVRQVVNNCVLDENFDVQKLPQFDVEFIFLKLRAISSSNVLTMYFQNKQCTANEGKPCDDKIRIDVDLNQVNIEQLSEDLETYVPYDAKKYAYNERGKQIMLTDTIGVLMAYPTLEDLKTIEDGITPAQNKEKLLLQCIKAVFDENTVHNKGVEFSDEDILEFYEDLEGPQKIKLQNFMNRVPILKKTLPFVCEKCKFKENINLIGLRDFLE